MVPDSKRDATRGPAPVASVGVESPRLFVRGGRRGAGPARHRRALAFARSTRRSGRRSHEVDDPSSTKSVSGGSSTSTSPRPPREPPAARWPCAAPAADAQHRAAPRRCVAPPATISSRRAARRLRPRRGAALRAAREAVGVRGHTAARAASHWGSLRAAVRTSPLFLRRSAGPPAARAKPLRRPPPETSRAARQRRALRRARAARCGASAAGAAEGRRLAGGSRGGRCRGRG